MRVLKWIVILVFGLVFGFFVLLFLNETSPLPQVLSGALWIAFYTTYVRSVLHALGTNGDRWTKLVMTMLSHIAVTFSLVALTYDLGFRKASGWVLVSGMAGGDLVYLVWAAFLFWGNNNRKPSPTG